MTKSVSIFDCGTHHLNAKLTVKVLPPLQYKLKEYIIISHSFDFDITYQQIKHLPAEVALLSLHISLQPKQSISQIDHSLI